MPCIWFLSQIPFSALRSLKDYVLIEPNRLAFKTMVLRETRKRSVAANACLSVNNYPRKMTFDAADVFGGVVASDHIPEQDIIGNVTCSLNH